MQALWFRGNTEDEIQLEALENKTQNILSNPGVTGISGDVVITPYPGSTIGTLNGIQMPNGERSWNQYLTISPGGGMEAGLYFDWHAEDTPVVDRTSRTMCQVDGSLLHQSNQAISIPRAFIVHTPLIPNLTSTCIEVGRAVNRSARLIYYADVGASINDASSISCDEVECLRCNTDKVTSLLPFISTQSITINRNIPTSGMTNRAMSVYNTGTYSVQLTDIIPAYSVRANWFNGAINQEHEWAIGTVSGNDYLYFQHFGDVSNKYWLNSSTVGSQLNETITHLTISNDNLQIGEIVEMTGDTMISKIEKTESGQKIVFQINPVQFKADDCCPVIKRCSTINQKYCGVVTEVFEPGSKITVGSGFQTEIITDIKCYKFATHGDFKVKVISSDNLSIGSILLSDGFTLDPETTLTFKLNSSIVGKVSRIIDHNTVCVFKE